MTLIFVHGWGVRKPDYGLLPPRLRQLVSGAVTIDVWLSDYISYSDSVTMADLAVAFERARRANFPAAKFACITHSTGGPVLRTWLDTYFRDGECPLTHLVMLAPPNHGSALAQLGKSRLARMKLWFQGVEPGEQILDWLELGSPQAWDLNVRWAQTNWPERGVSILVLTGAAIDHKLYDHLNSYTGERGSDGVVRTAAANLNYSVLRLRQSESGVLEKIEIRQIEPNFFGVLSGASHSGNRLGIMASEETAVRVAAFLTEPIQTHLKPNQTQSKPNPACCMLIFRVIDSAGQPIPDYDLLLTSGPRYSPDHLPRGFFIDRQRNHRAPNMLTYYLDHAVMSRTRELGFRLEPRPSSGPVHFAPAEFRGDLATVEKLLRPHQTLLVEIECARLIDNRVFQVVEQRSTSTRQL